MSVGNFSSAATQVRGPPESILWPISHSHSHFHFPLSPIHQEDSNSITRGPTTNDALSRHPVRSRVLRRPGGNGVCWHQIRSLPWTMIWNNQLLETAVDGLSKRLKQQRARASAPAQRPRTSPKGMRLTLSRGRCVAHPSNTYRARTPVTMLDPMGRRKHPLCIGCIPRDSESIHEQSKDGTIGPSANS